jgi:phage-related protein (TIGR01555 family)
MADRRKTPKRLRVTDSPERADARTLRARTDAAVAQRDGLSAAIKAAGNRKADGWQNILTGLGDPSRDKRMAAGVFVDRITYDELATLYRADDMAAKICDRPAKAMVRAGFEVHLENDGGEIDEESADAVEAKLFQGLDVRTRFYDAERYSRAYGGAGIFIGAVDRAKDASVPLDEERIEEIKFLTVLDARELYPLSYYADPLSPSFGLPEYYRVRPAFVGSGGAPAVAGSRAVALTPQQMLPIVHESRILRFPGVITNRWQLRETLGWGDSVLQRVQDVLRDFQMSWHAAAYLITDFSQAVATMKGISEAIENGDDKSVQARLLAIEMMRSVARMVVMDEGETFERKATPLSGLDTLLDKFFTRLAAAADIPVTLLAGEAPAGLNATGASDIRSYYDEISSLQRWRHDPLYRRLVTLLCKSKQGPTSGVLPEKIEINFNPLWQPTALEEAQRRGAVATADAIYIDKQVLDPAEVAIARFGGAKYSSEITIDTEARKQFLEENPPGEERDPPPGAPGAPALGPDGKPLLLGAGKPDDDAAEPNQPAKGGEKPNAEDE